MAGWHVLEAFITKAGEHSTWAGKFYNTFFDCFRLLFLVSIVDNTFGGDEAGLECDTQVVGCEAMCQNAFLPIDVITFWAVQMFAVCLPTVIFMTYMVHKLKAVEDARKVKDEKETRQRKKAEMELNAEEAWLKQARQGVEDEADHFTDQVAEIEAELQALQDERDMLEEIAQVEQKLNKEGIKATSAVDQHELTPPKLMLGYFFMVLFRSLIEIGFLYLYFQVYIFDLKMPKTYMCGARPCLSRTTCFVARSNEKTWVLHIMFALALFTLSCSLLELFRLGIEKPYKAFKNRHKDISKNPEYIPANAQKHIPKFAA